MRHFDEENVSILPLQLLDLMRDIKEVSIKQ